MIKVYFSIRRSGRKFSYVKKGFGVIKGNDIVVYHDKTEMKRYEDCVKYCRPIPNKPNQFRGSFYQIEEVEVDKGYSYDTIEIEEELKKQGFDLDGIDEELFIQDIEGVPTDSVNWDFS